MRWRGIFTILAVLSCFSGVPLAAAKDKSFIEIFEKIGQGDFDRVLRHVWEHANDGNGTANLLFSKV